MRTILKKFSTILILALILTALAIPAYAAEDTDVQETAVSTEETVEENATGNKAQAAGLAIGLAAAGGALAMGLAVRKSAEGIARQPEAESKIRTTLMLGLVFIETAIIYALLVVILIIFIL